MVSAISEGRSFLLHDLCSRHWSIASHSPLAIRINDTDYLRHHNADHVENHQEKHKKHEQKYREQIVLNTVCSSDEYDWIGHHDQVEHTQHPPEPSRVFVVFHFAPSNDSIAFEPQLHVRDLLRCHATRSIVGTEVRRKRRSIDMVDNEYLNSAPQSQHTW
jgi:hypothetical protein